MAYPIYSHHTNYHVEISDSEYNRQFVYGVCHDYYVSSAPVSSTPPACANPSQEYL